MHFRPRGSCTRALLLAGLAACSHPAASPSDAPREPEPVAVTVAPVELGPVQRVVHATGTLFGEERSTVAAKVPGRIDAVYHDVGDRVEPGERLVHLESTDYELAVAERARALEQTLAQLGVETLPGDGFSVDALPAVERARLQAENARARFERGRILHERKPPAMSDQDFSDLETAWEVAKADHRVAQLDARAEMAQARTLKAQLESAQQRLTDTLHVVPKGERPPAVDADATAPSSVDFVVTARRVSIGDYVQVGAPMFELIDPDPLKLRVPIPERKVAAVRLGQRVRLSVEAYAQTFEGRVARINPAVDARTRTFEAEIAVPNADGRLRAGSFAKVDIETDLEPDVVLVPRTAVRTFAGVHKVFVVDKGKAAERVLTLGQDVGERIEVVQGLKRDEVLVPDPPAGLTSGTPVRTSGESASK